MENDYVNKIKQQVPSMKPDELRKNNYTLYSRKYSLWKGECQLKYGSDSVAKAFDNDFNFADNLGTLSKITYACFAVGLVFCGFTFKSRPCIKIVSLFFIIGLQIAGLILSINALGQLYDFNLEMVSYAVDYRCSDSMLNYALKEFYDTAIVVRKEVLIIVILYAIVLAMAAFPFLLSVVEVFSPSLMNELRDIAN